MTTKTEYREYIASEGWQQRRKLFLNTNPHCNRCGLPRWLAAIAYDQDLHVHHKNYIRVGAELDSDLEPLCKRCHEIETFGKTLLHEVRAAECSCGSRTFDLHSQKCDVCKALKVFIGGHCSSEQFVDLWMHAGPQIILNIGKIRAQEDEVKEKIEQLGREPGFYLYGCVDAIKHVASSLFGFSQSDNLDDLVMAAILDAKDIAEDRKRELREQAKPA